MHSKPIAKTTESHYIRTINRMARDYGNSFEAESKRFHLELKPMTYLDWVRLDRPWPTLEEHLVAYPDEISRPHYINIPEFVKIMPSLKTSYKELYRASYLWFLKSWCLPWPKLPSDEELALLGIQSKGVNKTIPDRVLIGIGILIRLIASKDKECKSIADACSKLRKARWIHVRYQPTRLFGIELFPLEKEYLTHIGNYFGGRGMPAQKIVQSARFSNSLMPLEELITIEEITRGR